MIFDTARLLVRRFAQEDAEAFFRLNGDEEVMRYIRPPKSRQDSDAFLLENINLYRDGSVIGRYAVEDKNTGEVIGMFSLLYLAGEADLHIGYALLPAEWGKGYASELTNSGKAFFFANTDKTELFAITNPENRYSEHVLLKAGFVKKEEKIENNRPLSIFHTRSADFAD